MQVLSIIFAGFAALGAIDLIIGNKFGLGAEFRRGIRMFGELILSMTGMILLSPLIAELISTPLVWLYNLLHIDPSSFVGCLLANDMGGADLAERIAQNSEVGKFSGLVVGSMMGVTFSFTLPFIMGTTKKEQRDSILLGLICGICTIPIGCFVAGLFCDFSIPMLLLNLIPVALLSIVATVGLILFRTLSLKVCNVIGIIIRTLVIFGLAVGILEYLTDFEILPHIAPLEDGIDILIGIMAVMAGAFPLIYLLTKLLKKPLCSLSSKTSLNDRSILGFLTSVVTSAPMYAMMCDMDDRGVVLNSAFAVSGAFIIADHLAFTMAFEPSYVGLVVLGKFISAIAAVVLAIFITRKKKQA